MAHLYQDKSISAGLRAENLLTLMTVEEKIGQLNQRLYGFSVYERKGNEIIISDELKQEVDRYSGLGVLYGLYRADPWSGKDFDTGLTGALATKAYNRIQQYVLEHSRLKIPMMLSTECPHGHQALDGYLLPVNLCAGATFHPELLNRAYQVCGSQLKEMGVHMALLSTLDVLRDPRWGRSEECYSEDPYLSAELAKAAITGIQETGLIAVAKHFCAQGEGTGGINASAARIGERELREIHLPAAKACSRAGVKGIMAAYNEIDGIPCHGNKKLLTHILREELGFQGVIMADGVAIDQLDVMTGNNVLSGAVALKSGVDISLWDNGFSKLKQALDFGYITMEDIDRAVLRVLTMKFELGLFEQPFMEESDSWTGYTYEKHNEALDLARESVVLLKNEEDILPLKINKTKKIAVIGPNADEIYHQLGDYTPPVREGQGVTVLKGIRDLITEMKSDVEISYSRGCSLLEEEDSQLEEAVQLAGESDYVILVLGGSSSRFAGADFDSNGAAITGGRLSMDCGEGVDCSDLDLPGLQNKLAQAVSQTGRPVISVFIQGRPYSITETARCSKAALAAFYPGIMGGRAIAEILFGKISPSGRLPVSIPRHSGQVPVYYNYKSSYLAMNYYDIEKAPLYAFGYGLSYTKFKYSDISLTYHQKVTGQAEHKLLEKENHQLSKKELKEGLIQLTFSITNEGSMDAYAVPQLYIRDMQGSTIRRVRELKAFEKVWVPKKETVACTLTLDEEKLSIWNQDMNFTAEPGEFKLFLSDCGEDIWTDRLLLTI